MRRSKYDGKFKIGDKYKKWTIIDDKLNYNSKHEAYITAQCECGAIKNISCYHLLKQNSTGCFNCGHGNKGELNSKWTGYKEVPGTFIARIKQRALKIEVDLNINSEDIYNLWIKQNKKCALSGLDIDFINLNLGNPNRRSSKYDLICTASPDRIDSNKGYTLDNVQLVHKDINIMKNEYSQDYFIKLCQSVTKNNI